MPELMAWWKVILSILTALSSPFNKIWFPPKNQKQDFRFDLFSFPLHPSLTPSLSPTPLPFMHTFKKVLNLSCKISNGSPDLISVVNDVG